MSKNVPGTERKTYPEVDGQREQSTLEEENLGAF